MLICNVIDISWESVHVIIRNHLLDHSMVEHQFHAVAFLISYIQFSCISIILKINNMYRWLRRSNVPILDAQNLIISASSCYRQAPGGAVLWSMAHQNYIITNSGFCCVLWIMINTKNIYIARRWFKEILMLRVTPTTSCGLVVIDTRITHRHWYCVWWWWFAWAMCVVL